MSDSLASFASLFRAVLMLQGDQAPVSKPDTVRATVKQFGLNAEPFEKIFAFRANDFVPPSEKDANDIFAAYMEQIDHVIQAVDDFDQGQP